MTAEPTDHPRPFPASGGGDPAGAAAGVPSRLRDLHPGWFASVMGTAILAVATYDNPGNVAALRGTAHGLGTGLAVVAYVLGAVPA